MSVDLDQGYFAWLYGQIGSTTMRNPARSHWSLAKQLYCKPFSWKVQNDDNRVEDAYEMRMSYIRSIDCEGVDPVWESMDISVLEMLLVLCEKLAFQTDSEPYLWFWKLIDNLGFFRFTDDIYDESIEKQVDMVLQRWIDRKYKSNGEGGLFPLKRPKEDQRRVELWYQLSAYLLENTDIAKGE